MTDHEKQRERSMKERVYRLFEENRERLLRHAALSTDTRLRQYVESVMGNPEEHNLYEALAVWRFFEMLGRHGWNAHRVNKFCKFYEAVKFNGKFGRTRYKLTPVQVFQFANMFGFTNEEGMRLTRTVYLFVPRKFSKTTSAASLAVYDMLFGDNNAQAYVGANSYNQAKICFDEIRAIMRDLDPKEKHFRINREKVFFKTRGRNSMACCLSGNAKTQDGLMASLVIMDEYAQARDTSTKKGSDLKNVLISSMGTRDEPLVIIITTASDVLDGPCFQEIEGVKKILRGEAENDTIFASLFMPDVDDDEGDERTWRKVQPHWGVTVKDSFYREQWENAQLTIDNMLTFRTKLLNVFCVNEKKQWFTGEQARKLMGPFDIDRVEGMECAVAFDLSVHDDFSAVDYTVFSREKKCFYSHTEYYFPRGALKQHPNRELYTEWAEKGWLILCDGDNIDVRMVAEDIIKRSRKHKIISIVYDSYKAQYLTNMLVSAGADKVMKPFSQTYGSFNLAVESFEMLAYENPPKYVMNENPINVYCLENCVIDEDRLENKKPIKIAHERKIDGTIVKLMNLGAMYNYKQ
jgi:phage terminase large subunit-like protein